MEKYYKVIVYTYKEDSGKKTCKKNLAMLLDMKKAVDYLNAMHTLYTHLGYTPKWYNSTNGLFKVYDKYEYYVETIEIVRDKRNYN